MAAEQLDLNARVERLESLAVRGLATFAALLLLAGSVLPYTEISDQNSTMTTTTIASMGVQAFIEPGDDVAFSVLFGGAYLVLAIVSLLSIIALISITRRGLGLGMTRFVTTMMVLLVLGALGAWLMMSIGLSKGEWTLEPGLPVFSVGVLLAATAGLAPALRRLWSESLG
ncbi:hypothetical protein CLV47_10392 [Antricoccus suffuscus]|uniref:Uncharacterized protein n=1 Tax=Antricoccus suffuscus TaxID=1629062 RepID=A0A2T1A371_9ACTN|nr:hypothetical protein [Antricoccus suffuscus]PRZ43036.1 hypothetical protein CLV47_10392 [Antricoccus suffuscus]